MSKHEELGRWGSESPIQEITALSLKEELITSPIPLSGDDEFPFRSPIPGIETSLDAEDIDEKPELRASTHVSHDSIVQQDVIDDPADNIDIEESGAIPPQPAYEAPPPPTAPIAQETTEQTFSGISQDLFEEKPKRKKSSLRALFSKIFKRKPKNDVSSTREARASSSVRAELHRSDPHPLSRVGLKSSETSQQRSVSLPINEYNRALRSHSIATEDFPLTPTTEAKHNSIHEFEDIKPRRATLSGVWTPYKIPGNGSWTGLSPRPASSHARGSRFVTDGEPEAAVGIALTSGSNPNRKSRSVGELRGHVPTSLTRVHRSDEIKYWRESYEPALLSPLSSNRGEADEPTVLDEADNPRVEEAEPPQPFNFGPMVELAGAKITAAASLEDRVIRLEEVTHEMEKVIYRSRSRTSTNQFVFRDPYQRSPRREHSLSTSRPRTDTSEYSLPGQQVFRESQPPEDSKVPPVSRGSQKQSLSYDSRRPSTISTNTSYQPSFDNDQRQSAPIPNPKHTRLSQNTARPLSDVTTIRGIPSSPPKVPKDGYLTFEHYIALTKLIMAEQAARQELEAIVMNLQQRIQTMAWTSDPAPTANHANPGGNSGEQSHFDISDDEGLYTSEDFRTSNEEPGRFGDEIFGEVQGNNPGIKATPRVVSLSQMTLGKAAQDGLKF